ncbi:similar to An09g06360 [Aspergillus luchuensis]|uniref:Similar to An09g06360 n=1 Tax=Aspergillus kawachii TaxID=1069201 RepID=A0A146FGN0_ASPKA|nr:hypothetical protein ALUC_40893A [Aspergillus luchuensis]GAT25170.1 similar to An09g06360 [Aspergillus luchuensis]
MSDYTPLLNVAAIVWLFNATKQGPEHSMLLNFRLNHGRNQVVELIIYGCSSRVRAKSSAIDGSPPANRDEPLSSLLPEENVMTFAPAGLAELTARPTLMHKSHSLALTAHFLVANIFRSQLALF